MRAQDKKEFQNLQAESVNFDAEPRAKMTKPQKTFNRYDDIYPYQFNCIRTLAKGYVNASSIHLLYDDFDKKEYDHFYFIASQAPNPKGIDNFLTVLIEKKVAKIFVMSSLNQDEKRYEKYWPEMKDDSIEIENIVISCKKYVNHQSYIERQLMLRKGKEIHFLTHFHYLEWPDFSIPKKIDGLNQLIHLALSSRDKKEICLVHCSAGIGRTGTFLALSNLLYYSYRQKQAIDLSMIKRVILNLRKQRRGSVQSLEQYTFIKNYFFKIQKMEEETKGEDNLAELYRAKTQWNKNKMHSPQKNKDLIQIHYHSTEKNIWMKRIGEMISELKEQIKSNWIILHLSITTKSTKLKGKFFVQKTKLKDLSSRQFFSISDPYCQSYISLNTTTYKQTSSNSITLVFFKDHFAIGQNDDIHVKDGKLIIHELTTFRSSSSLDKIPKVPPEDILEFTYKLTSS